MKKFKLVAIAAVLAIAFSAFTASRPTDQLYYWDGDSMEEYTEGNECDPGSQEPCTVAGFGTLYTAPNHDPAYIYEKDVALVR